MVIAQYVFLFFHVLNFCYQNLFLGWRFSDVHGETKTNANVTLNSSQTAATATALPFTRSKLVVAFRYASLSVRFHLHLFFVL